MRKIRKEKIFGRAEKPRLVIFKSNKHIYGQIIDDGSHKVLLALSNTSKDVSPAVNKGKTKTEVSKLTGKDLAEKAVKKDIKQVVFDRNGYLFHGRVKAFAEGAREGGLKF